MSDDNIKKLPAEWNVQPGDIEIVVKKRKREESPAVQMTAEFWDKLVKNCCDLLDVWSKANPDKLVCFGLRDDGTAGYKVATVDYDEEDEPEE